MGGRVFHLRVEESGRCRGWRLDRCAGCSGDVQEVLFDRLGYDHPPSYVLIADAALLAFCASATIQRYVSGVRCRLDSVLGVVWVIALWLTAGELAICSLDISMPIISMMPVMIIAAVVLFWCIAARCRGAAHGDVAPLLLVLGGDVYGPRSGHAPSIC